MASDQGSSLTGRREPPPFRQIAVISAHQLTRHMIRVTFAGDELKGLSIEEPAASVRILLPTPGSPELVMPEWNGNEFLLSDGSRPILRTFTPRTLDTTSLQLDIDMVVHNGGVASQWALAAKPGDPAALSGPGRGYTIDPDASGYILGGDETAIPAIAQLLESLPKHSPVRVEIEIRSGDARLDLPSHPTAEIAWHVLGSDREPGAALVEAVQGTSIATSDVVWCAGEAASMHRIRNYLFKEVGLKRSQATVRGYWKIDRKT